MTLCDLEKPIFLFCSGMRSGSTLLQRVIIGSGETMVWGETGGALDHLQSAWECYLQMLGPGGKMFPGGLGGNGDQQLQEFIQQPTNRSHLWIPCINSGKEKLAQALRGFFQEYYCETAEQLGFKRWGIKKVRSDLATAKFMKELFPGAKFVFLIREPLACLQSIKQHDWMDHPGDPKALNYYIDQWKKTAGSFKNADFGYKLHYEDLVNSPQVRQELFGYLEIQGVADEFFKKSRPKGRSDTAVQLSYFEKRKILKKTIIERAAFHFSR